MGAMLGRGCRTAGDAGTGSPRGGISLPRSRRGAARQRAGARVRASGRHGVGLGQRSGCWARAKRCGSTGAARRQAGPPVRLGRKRGGGPVRGKWKFSILFLIKFQKAVFKYPFEQENDFFLKLTKNKNCLELNPLQLCFYDQSQILSRFLNCNIKVHV